MLYRIVIVAALLVLASIGNSTRAADRTAKPVPSSDQSAIARRGYFYVGGAYVGKPGEQRMHEQMYVEVLTPRHPRQRYPLVLIHGAAQTATNWMGTSDGRPGWVDYLSNRDTPSTWLTSRIAAARRGCPMSTASSRPLPRRRSNPGSPPRKPSIFGRRQNRIRNGRAPGASATPYSTPFMRRRCRIWPMVPRPSGSTSRPSPRCSIASDPRSS